MISWFDQMVSVAMGAVQQGDIRALAALLLVAAFTEMCVPFPFVIDSVLLVTSYQSGLWSIQIGQIVIALLLGRQFGAAVMYWLSRLLGNAFINRLVRRFPRLSGSTDWLTSRLGSRWTPLALAFVRLTPGLLTPSSVASGAIGIRYDYFVLGITLYTIIADGALIVFGFVVGQGLEYLGFAPAVWMLVVALVIAISLVWLVYRYWQRRRSR